MHHNSRLQGVRRGIEAIIPDFSEDSGKIFAILIALAFAALALSRIFAVLSSGVPIGYDFGLYKHAFELHASQFPNIYSSAIPQWYVAWTPIGMYLVADLISLTGLKPADYMTPLIIILELLAAVAVYFCAKEYFGKKAAVFSLLFFCLSMVQFKVFEYFYLKNILGILLLFAALCFMKKRQAIPLVISAGLLAGIHRPTFLVFAACFAAYFFINAKDWKRNLLAGAGMLAFVLLFYWNSFQSSIIDMIFSGISVSGNFLDFTAFLSLSVWYWPFAVIALAMLFWKRQSLEIAVPAVILLIITLFQIIFYNRFLIHLDLLFILIAGIGFSAFLASIGSKELRFLFFAFVALSAAFAVFTVPVWELETISRPELDFITHIKDITEPDASILVTAPEYSTWVLGFSGRNAICPGFSDQDKWSEAQWQEFWDTESPQEAIKMLSVYKKPLYIFTGDKTVIEGSKFNDPCFEDVAGFGYTWLVKVKC